MAIQVRGPRAYMSLTVLSHQVVPGGDRPLYDVVLGTPDGSDADTLTLRTGWRRALEEFPIGTAVSLELYRTYPAGVAHPPSGNKPMGDRQRQ